MSTLIFIAPINWEDKNSGVSLKVKNEYLVFNKYFDSYISAFEGNDVVIYHGEECVYRDDSNEKHRVLKQFGIDKFIIENSIDYVYIRYALAFPQQIAMLKRIRNHVKKIVVEFPDYPYIREWVKAKKPVQVVMDILLRSSYGRYIDRAFACTNKKSINGIDTSQLINGTNIEDYSIKQFDEHDYIGIISVSSMSTAHGIDRFIRGMNDYYNNGGVRDIRFSVIGNGVEYENLSNLVKSLKLSDRVTLYGFIPNGEQDSFYANNDIGLGAIGFHRISIKDDSTLKSREYGLRGMPIIAENKIDIVDDTFPYVMYCPKDESPVDINKVVAFYDACFMDKSKKEVGEAIRYYFIERCDINRTMIPVVRYFESNE